MKTLDKYIIKAFAVNYVISLTVLLSTYVFLDMFFNFDEFTEDTGLGFWALVRVLGQYYGAHLFLYFTQISGVITLFAMAFTLLRLQRNNEFVAIVSSGVSLYRVALTVIVAGLALNALWLLNQELAIPALGPRLAQSHRAAALDHPYGVWFVRDRNGTLLSASRFDHDGGELYRLVAIRPSSPGGDPLFITADRATWTPSAVDDGGIWQLQRGAVYRRSVDDRAATEIRPEAISGFPSDLGPDEIAMRQSTKWIQFLSRRQLTTISRQGIVSGPRIARAIHGRFTTPVINMLILVVGIPFFVDRQPGSVVHSGGRCLLVCGGCFLFAFFAQTVSFDQYPVLTAWLPLLVLVPVMVVVLDGMRT